MGTPWVAPLLVLTLMAGAAPAEATPAPAHDQPAAAPIKGRAVADPLDDSGDPPRIRALWASIDALLRQGRQQEAIPLLRQLLVWQDRHLGTDQERSLRSLMLLTGTLLYAAFRPKEASEASAELHKRLVRVGGAGSFDAAEALLLQARAEKSRGAFATAGALAWKAQEQLQAFAAVLPLKLADAWELIGTIQQEEGRYRMALESLRRAMELRERHGAPMLMRARSESNMGQILLRLGRPAESLRRLQQALARYASLAEETRANRSAVLSNIGAAEQAMGRLDQAIEALGRSLTLRESLGPDTPDTAQIRLNRADLLAQSGRPAEALAETRRALAVLERQLGPRHVQTAMARYRLGDLARLRGDPSTALVEYGRALTIRRQLAPDHPDLATTHLGIALSRLALGQNGAAERDLERALAIRRQAYGEGHPYTLQVLFLLGLLHNFSGQRQRSYAELRVVAEGHARFLQREAPLLPQAERDRVVGSLEPVRQAIYSLAQQGPEAAAVAFQLRLNQHGLLEAIERRQRDLLTADPAIAAATNQLLSLQGALSDQRLDPAARSRLNQRRAEQERQLYAAVPELAPKVVEPTALAPSLGDDGALVEYARYRPTELRKGRLTNTAAPRYLAFVSNGRAVKAVNLGEAAPIEEAVRRALRSTRVQDPAADRDWGEVRRLIVEPLLPAIGGRSRIYMSPDAELHRVAFAALGLEGWRLRLLTSGRDLLDPPATGTAGPALVVAAPDYGEGSEARAPGVDQLFWPPLPRTRDEGIRVHDLMGGRLAMDAGASVALVMGTRSPRVLHLASHGGFLPGVEAEPDGSVPGDPLAEHPVDATTALRRAVVVLAGANRGVTSEGDDGYLSALEVSLMHLDQTRLVTLSACETNRGEIRTGEGVYGLRRALTVAGARTSLLSLWKVNDDATSALMGAFYTHLARGEEPHRALEAAQATFRDQRDGKLRHPFWWAGFQLYGP